MSDNNQNKKEFNKLYVEPDIDNIPVFDEKKDKSKNIKFNDEYIQKPNLDNISMLPNDNYINQVEVFNKKFLINPNLDNIHTFDGKYNNKIKAYRDFRKGLNVDNISDALSINELVIADNVDYSKRGSINKRPDVKNYNNTSYGQQVEEIFEWIKEDGIAELMAVMSDEYLYKIDGPDSKTSIFKLSNTYIDIEVLKNYLYILDGNNYYRIDDETYNYEPVPEKDTSEIIDDAKTFEATMDSSSTLIEDYPIVTDSETIYKASDLETEFEKDTDYTIDYSNGTITPLSSGNMTDGESYYADFQYKMPSDNDLSPIKNCKYIIRHPKSYRFFAAGNPNDPKAIYFSEYNDPAYFKDTSVLYPTTNDGPVQGLAVIDEMLAVLFQHSIWVWRGIDPETDAVWENLPVKHGTENYKTITTTFNALTFLDQNGIYALNSNKGLKNITKNKVNNIIKNIENIEYCVSTFDPKNNRYLLAYSDITGRNDKILSLDWDLGAYSRWTGLQANDFCFTQDGKLLMATENYIKVMNEPAENTSNNVNYHIKTKPLTLENPYYKKIAKKLMLNFANLSSNCEVTVNLIIDGSTFKTLNVTNDDTISQLLDKGVNFQIEIINDQAGENIQFLGFALEYLITNTYDNEL